jgi:hypothetical protein
VALVFGIGEVLIGLRRVFHVGLVIKYDARALREREPAVVVVLQIGGDAGLQNVAFDGLQKAKARGARQRTVSTVRNTSTGLLAPSACMRAINSSALPSIRLIVMPVASVKSE